METSYHYHALIVEDDTSIRKFLSINLNRNGFAVTETAAGGEALRLLSERRHDAMILDLMLPDMDGFEVCRRVREVDADIVIVILTARGQDLDKIRGLELGADDYVLKPFNPLELVARIKTVLRRTRNTSGSKHRILQSGMIRIDLAANEVYRRDEMIEMTPKEFLMLKAFVEHPGQALSRNELLNLIWGEDFVGDTKTVDVHVRKLREKLEEDSSGPRLIETVWGLGYRWRKGS